MATSTTYLKRELNLFGAVGMGLGAMLGTGVFVSIGIAAGIAGPAVILATILAAGVAVCNGLSSAQLAASHPVSGGTYEYGYRYLNSWFGFSAGWMFLLAKSASAATAALGFAGYCLQALNYGQQWQTTLALIAVVTLTILVLSGIRRSSAVNIVIVSVTVVTLVIFVVVALPAVSRENFTPVFKDEAQSLASLLEASALMFVAYTGYGRIATLGEEVREPARTIPRAIVITMLVVMALYIAVAVAGVGAVGIGSLRQSAADLAAPLAMAADTLQESWLAKLVALGAVTAMLGVLLNLVLGLSRVLLAMGRRHDAPALFGRLNATATAPVWATLGVSALIATLVLVGDVKTTWSFSAFTVLIYYAITNLAALRLPANQRLYPRWIAALGLGSCLFLAFWVDSRTWLAGSALLCIGLLWHAFRRRQSKPGFF